MSWDGRLWATNGSLTRFDGRATGQVVLHRAATKKDTTVHLSTVTQSIGDDGRLYVKDFAGAVHRIDRAATSEPTGGKGRKGGEGTDPYVATLVGTVPSGSSAITVAGGRLWASGSSGVAEVCAYTLKG